MIFLFNSPLDRLRRTLYPKMQAARRDTMSEADTLNAAADLIEKARAVFSFHDFGQVQASRTQTNELLKAIIALDNQ
jgi:hypothetical protein